MLAFELFLKNRDSPGVDAKSLKPIKKIIFKNSSWVIDSKTIEEYGSATPAKFSSLQNWLSMPLSTSNAEKLNLPDFRTSSAQPSPYVMVYGTMKTNKSKESMLILSIGKSPSVISHTFDVKSGAVAKKESQVTLKLEKKNYMVGKNSLFEQYVKSGLVDSDGKLNKKTYEEIILKFIEFATKRKLDNPFVGNINFSLFLVPSNEKISFDSPESKKDSSKSFKDSFGSSAQGFASGATKTSKFLSFDDKAFTLNCKQDSEFYENIGIGSQSLDKIYFPKEQTFNISGMSWVFTDISSNIYKFVETRRGIFSQIYENYKIISESNHTNKEKAVIKVICYKQQQAKQEIMIDENLTMEKMNRMFTNINNADIPFHAFEILIESIGKSVLWSAYLYAVKNFLSENMIPKDYLLSIFSKMLRSKIHSWLKTKSTDEQKEFFSQSEFCIKTLTNRTHDQNIMNTNEEFAFKIGQIAKRYIDFKQKISEENNSLKDILTYSKYDREKLRFVLQRIGIGVNLAKANEKDVSAINEVISSLYPKNEIEDSEAHKDYSYFFYKGFYQNKEVLA